MDNQSLFPLTGQVSQMFNQAVPQVLWLHMTETPDKYIILRSTGRVQKWCL